MPFIPCLKRSIDEDGRLSITLGDRLVDDYLDFVAARVRPNTLLAHAYDLKVFFSVVAKQPVDVTPLDVLDFIKAQRQPRVSAKVVRIEDGESGLSARTIMRRLSSVSGMYSYLIVRGDTSVRTNPVPRGLPTRAKNQRQRTRMVPLLRPRRMLPRICSPSDVNSIMESLRTERDRAMVEAMLFGGLRRCEVLGLLLEDVRVGERRLFIREGKGGAQRIVPVSSRFFSTLARYFESERPTGVATERVFVVLKGPRRGLALSAAGLDEIIAGVKGRSGVASLTCHQLRHTCFTRLREAGMALEAIQAQAGHRSIESTRIYLHLSSDWLEREYTQATRAIDADTTDAGSR